MKSSSIASALVLLLITTAARAEVLIDEPWTTTEQLIVRPFPEANNVVVGVNFINNTISSPEDSTLLGIGFDDVDVDPITGETYDFGNDTGGGSYNLTANGGGATLQTRFGFLHDRHDIGPEVNGDDADVANIVKTDIHTICHVRDDDCHEQEMTIGGLSRNAEVYLQFLGGDEGWNGQLDMFVNGDYEGTWISNTDNPSTFGFTTTTNAAGELDIDMDIVEGTNFAGISAFYVIERGNTLPGDYNGDGRLDVEDVDAQALAISDPDPDLAVFDENGDETVDVKDREIWVRDHMNTWMGDADLDGEFNSTDFVVVFTAGKYETGEPAGWGDGDWDGNLAFDSSDFVAGFTDGGYERGPRQALAVPEPASFLALMIGSFGVAIRRRFVASATVHR